MSRNGQKQNSPSKATPPKKDPPSCTLFSKSKPEYNVVYEKLVNNDNDIIGQLAYCLYKQSKQQYLREFEKRNNRRPTDEELANHVSCSEIPALSMYKEKATSVFTDILIQAAAEKQDELEKHFKGQLWQFINKHQPESFGERIWFKSKALIFSGFGGVTGNFMTTLIVLTFLFWAASGPARDGFTKSAKESFISGLAEITGVSISITRPTPPVEQGLDR